MRILSLLVAIVGLNACGYSTPPAYAPMHSEATAKKDFALAYALSNSLSEDAPSLKEVRDQRVHDFEALVQSQLAKYQPITPDNAEAAYGTLLALRKLSGYAEPPPASGYTYRILHDDLDPVARALIEPKIQALIPLVWQHVEAVSEKEPLAAIQLAAALLAQLPAGNAYEGKLEPLLAKGAEKHLALAKSARETQAPNRVLHARIAAQLGAEPGPLLVLGPPFDGLVGQTWIVTSDGGGGSCGDSTSSYDSAPDKLTDRLRKANVLASKPGHMEMHMSINFDSCPVTEEKFTSTAESRPYRETVRVQVPVVKSRYANCFTSTVTSGSTTERTRYYDKVIERTTPGSSYSTTRCGGQEEYTDGEMEWQDKTIERTENYGVSHSIHHAKARGSIRVSFKGGAAQDIPFDVRADSDDDTSYSSVRGPSKSAHGFGKAQARDRLFAQLVAKIVEAKRLGLEARAARYVKHAEECAAQPDQHERATSFYFVASLVTGKPQPNFFRFMEKEFAVPPDVLQAAIDSQPLPKRNLAAAYAIKLPEVKPWKYR